MKKETNVVKGIVGRREFRTGSPHKNEMGAINKQRSSSPEKRKDNHNNGRNLLMATAKTSMNDNVRGTPGKSPQKSPTKSAVSRSPPVSKGIPPKAPPPKSAKIVTKQPPPVKAAQVPNKTDTKQPLPSPKSHPKI